VLWDLNSWKARVRWADVNHIRDKVTVRVYCFDSFDKSFDIDILDAWDAIRAYFRVYETILDGNAQIKITNLNDQPCEYFQVGLTVDSDIAVAFDLEMDLFCDSIPSSLVVTIDSTGITIDSTIPIS
jgi:hypothetical protein